MQFKLTAANPKTGEEASVEVEAATAEAAAKKVNDRGYLVSNVAVLTAVQDAISPRRSLTDKQIILLVSSIAIIALTIGTVVVLNMSNARSPDTRTGVPLAGSRNPLTPDATAKAYHAESDRKATIIKMVQDVPADFHSRTVYVTKCGNFLKAKTLDKLQQALKYKLEGNVAALSRMQDSPDLGGLNPDSCVRIFNSVGDCVQVGQRTFRYWTVRDALIEEESLPAKQMTICMQDFGNDWPLALSEGVLTARQLPFDGSSGPVELLFTAVGKTYALNGTAMSMDKYIFVDEIVGRGKDTYPLIEWGVKQMEAENRRQQIPRSDPQTVERNVANFQQSVISKAKYNRTETGMTYREVAEIIGHEGDELSRNVIDGVPGVMPAVSTIMYVWQNRDGSNANFMFQNDKMIQRSQFGLK